jgi:hypothetical protein
MQLLAGVIRLILQWKDEGDNIMGCETLQPAVETKKKSPIARCPNCDTRSQFVYMGEQHWPERVAKASGMTPLVHLWQCENCHTTIVTPDVNV